MLGTTLNTQSNSIHTRIQLNRIAIVLLFLTFFNTLINATNVPEFVNLRQPNGYTFTARGEGDEFLQRFRTLDYYTIICSSNGWWYYAYQGKDGKLYPTQYRVGIEQDEAMRTLATDIDYSQAIIDATQLKRENLNKGLVIQSVTPKSVGVILIDFPDRIASRTDPAHPNDPLYISNAPSNSSWAIRYSMNDYVKLFFSENVYNTTSPDGTSVYGSFNDYYKKVSYGNVYIYGAILNQVDANGKPIWHRTSYSITTITRSQLISEAISKATAAGFNVSSYNAICVVFAGQWGGSTGNSNLWPSQSGNNWIMGERNSAWDGDYGFASVGVHVHEFAHYLGLGDYRPGSQSCSPNYGNGTGGYLLMAYGNYGADINHHSRPVLMSAYEKIALGYLTPEVISTNKTNYILPNIEDYNSAWKIVLASSPSEYFLVENRQPIGFDGGIPNGGLLITHYASNGSWYLVGKNPIDIEEVGAISPDACGVPSNLYPLDFRCRPTGCYVQYNSQIEAGDFVNTTDQVFGPWSAPNSNRKKIFNSHKKKQLAKHVGNNITKTEFERKMSICFNALSKCWELAF